MKPEFPNFCHLSGTPVLMWQTLSMFEVFHAAFELSPGASVTAECVTFAERMMVLIACLLPFPQLRTNAYVTMPFIAWSVTNVVRFAYAPRRPPLLCALLFSFLFDTLFQLLRLWNPASRLPLGLAWPFHRKFGFQRDDEVSQSRTILLLTCPAVS